MRGSAGDTGLFGNIVGVRRFDDLHYIVFAAGEKDLLDFAATLLGKILRRLRALEIIFDFANARIREVQGHDEQHVVLHGIAMSFSGGEHQSKRVRVQGGVISTICHFRFWHKADIARLSSDVRFWG